MNVSADSNGKTVWGITELETWNAGHGNEQAWEPSLQDYTGREVEDCLQAHLDAGIEHVIWHNGRSTTCFQTDNPLLSPYGSVGDFGRADPLTMRFLKMMQARCILEAALDYSREKSIVLAGRVTMNRHYGEAYGGVFTSDFYRNNPDFHEVGYEGPDQPVGRMCYAFAEVRRERIEFMMETVRKDVRVLHLDFVRQPPMALYHPRLVEGFRSRTGLDPRELKLLDGESYWEWMRFRSQPITLFMRELKSELEAFAAQSNEEVRVQVRVTDGGPDENLLAGVDLMAWIEEGLFDDLFTSPLDWIAGHYRHDLPAYAGLARKHRFNLYAGVGTLPVPGYAVNPLRLVRMALNALEAGVDGLALYQTDYSLTHPDLAWCLPLLGDAEKLRETLLDKDLAVKYPLRWQDANFGIDNHGSSYPYQTSFNSPRL
ncbi:MAG: hypothetical protein PHT56_06770 [Candidatus Izemoplasmatales bacterium]|nr:hypothetical protein [Candidatus Izemoplasmatales bacterium]